MLLVFGFALLLLIPTAAAVLIGALFGTVRRGGELPKWVRPWFFGWLAFAGSTLFSWGLGVSIHTFHVSSVKCYVLRATAILDDIRKKEGSYPKDLPVKLIGRPPHFLREPGSYSSDGRSFRFQYLDPATMDDGFVFKSEARTWTELEYD